MNGPEMYGDPYAYLRPLAFGPRDRMDDLPPHPATNHR